MKKAKKAPKAKQRYEVHDGPPDMFPTSRFLVYVFPELGHVSVFDIDQHQTVQFTTDDGLTDEEAVEAVREILTTVDWPFADGLELSVCDGCRNKQVTADKVRYLLDAVVRMDSGRAALEPAA